MKVRLETQDGIVVLVVSEDLSSQHIPILKAGLQKLFQSGKKTILVDLTQITQTDLPTLREASALRHLAPTADSQVVIASPIENIGQAKTRDEALKLMKSALFGLLAIESRLQAKLLELQKRKEELNLRLSTTTQADDFKGLRKENSDLRATVRELERQLAGAVKTRTPSFGLDSGTSLAQLKKTLRAVLEKEGVLPVKSNG